MRFSTLFGVGLLVASLTGPARALAQTYPCPPVGIRTNPANPADPSGKINTFNWYFGNYQVGTYEGTMYTLNSPFPGVSQLYIDLPWLQPSNAVMDSFQGRVDTPGDGWELIRRDFGYKDSGAPSQTTNPLLIIYNRRTSVLRVFTAVGDVQNNFQFAEIKLRFGIGAQYKAGTLNRMNALGVALEDTEPLTNPEFVSATRYLNSRSRWFVADFPMDYDPCVCQFDSRLAIEVNLITQADVRLIGKTTGTLISMQNGGTGTASGSTGPDMDSGLPFIRKANAVLGAGGKSYDNINKFSGKLKNLFPAKTTPIDALAAASKSAGFLKAGLGALPWVGAAVSMLDYFMGGGKDATGPQEVVMQPMTIEMSTTTTGTISTNNWFTSSSFNNPGNPKPDPVPEKMPYYNEAMGVFSLLRRPTVETQMQSTWVQVQGGGYFRENYRYRLAENLQYVINPASGLEVQDFQAALVLEIDGPPSPGAVTSFNQEEAPVVLSGGVLSPAFRTGYIDAACIKNQIFSFRSACDARGNALHEKGSLTLKVMLNLRPVGGSTTQQNVLFVARYPVTLNLVSSFAPLPLAACGVLPQASAATVQDVCSSTKYKQAILLARPAKVTAALGGSDPTKVELQGFPNPATGAILLRYHVAQAGPVQLTLSDGLGRKVRTVLDQQQVAAGSFETSVDLRGLRAGVYYCTLHTASQHKVERIVVTD